jgi:RimJ/RimL family protein N-acetyltransferase
LRGDKQFPHQLEAIAAFVRDQIAAPARDDNVRLLVEAEGQPVGSIRTFDTDPHNGTFSFHISTFKEHQRKGYAYDASALLMRYFFSELRYHKCVQDVFSFNDASIALHERLGFAREGCITEAIYAAGMYYDRLVFGLTAEIFVSHHGPT